MLLNSIGTPSLWIGFTAFVVALLVLDLRVFHRHAHEVKPREALTWSAIWIGLALLFNLGVCTWFGPERGMEFLAGFLIEKALAVDNIFIFVMLFAAFSVPASLQHKVLFWGILGALLMRAVFIILGAALLQQFHWVLYLFGAFLVLTGIKLFIQKDATVQPKRSLLFCLCTRFIAAVPGYHGDRFFIRQSGRWYATPLFFVLVAIEATDLVFAVDSIPAIFAVTSDPFIVYTSNIFAILGLRSLYFLLAGMVQQFHYLKTGLALILAFVGVKMLLIDLYKLPISLSLTVIAVLLGGSVLASVLWPQRKAKVNQSLTPHAVLK